MNRRFALIQALVSLIALAAVVWWASHQEPPELPSGRTEIAWLLASLVLYAVATLLRGERWHHILKVTGVDAHRSDCYALTTVGYMGNNVLPARAGEMLRVVLLSGRCSASKRTLLGSVVAERLLDAIALATIFILVVYGVLSSTVLPTDRPLLFAGLMVLTGLLVCLAIFVLRRHHVFERARDWLRPLADAPRSSGGREWCCSARRSCCGPSRRACTSRWPAASGSTSARWARSTSSRSPTSSRRCRRRPGRSARSTPP
jgi:hypothetical protein